MTKLQLGVVFGAVSLFSLLHFGCDTKPKTYQKIEKERALNSESTNIAALLQDAKKDMEAEQSASILGFEAQLQSAVVDSVKIKKLKLLAGKWFEFGHPEISGFYAQEIAEQEQDSEVAWSIAGTTYTICVQRTQVDKIREFCTARAVSSFENAISINPKNVAHRTNLALLYVENPPKEKPMQGILMLVDLNKQHPEDIGVLTNLGRLSIQTRQFEKAVQRLEKILSLEPMNIDATCMLIDAYKGLKQEEKAIDAESRCQALTKH